MIKELEIKTSRRNELVDITGQVQGIISESKITSGVCVIYCPHTTSGVTINENADPSVKRDLLEFLERNVPHSADYHHTEGNADAHIKASLVGSSVSVLFEKGKLLLGTWQGIFFCEFDRPRARRVWIKLIEG